MKKIQNTLANTALPPSFSRLRVMMALFGSSVLASTMPIMADASSLIPDEPSIEVHLEALDALRSNAQFGFQPANAGANIAAQNGAPFAVGESVQKPSYARTKPRYNPSYKVPSKTLAQTKAAPVKPAPKIAQATPIAQPVISSQSAPESPVEHVLAAPNSTPKLPPPPPLRSAENKVSNDLQPIALPTAKQNVAHAQEDKTPTSAVAALTQATQPNLVPLPEKTPLIPSASVPEKTVADISNTKNTLADTALAAKPSTTAAAPSISQLDFSQLGKPVAPAAEPSAALIAKQKTDIEHVDADADTDAVAPLVNAPAAQNTEVASLPTLPVLQKLPAEKPSIDLQKTPEAKKEIEQNSPRVLSENQSTDLPALPVPVSPVLVADNASKDVLNNHKPQAPDPALKNLSDRINNLFVKTPDKQGVVSDKTAITGPLQNLPELPKDIEPERRLAKKPKQLSLAEVNRLDPPESLSQKDPFGLPAAIPALPDTSATTKPVISDKPVAISAPKPSVVDALSKAVANAPTIANTPDLTQTIAPVKIEPGTPKLDFSALKPPVQSVQSSGATSSQKLSSVAPQTLEKKTASIVPVTVPGAPIVKPNADKAVLPTIPNAPARAVSSSDDLASLLPPPAKSNAPASANTLPNLSAITNRSADVSGTNSSLPSLASITGDTGRSSLDIVRDEQGVRTTSLAPPASLPISGSASVSTLSATSDYPKVTRGEKKAEVQAPVPVPLAQKSVPPLLPESKAVEEKAKPVINTTVVNSPAVPKFESVDAQSVDKAPSILQASAPKPASIARASEAPAAKVVSAKLSIPFEKDKVDVQQTMQSQIANVASSVKSNGKNVRIVAYASGKADETSAARRVSLSRALQVRAALISKGVDPMKITVQALGNTGNNGDRADILVN